MDLPGGSFHVIKVPGTNERLEIINIESNYSLSIPSMFQVPGTNERLEIINIESNYSLFVPGMFRVL